MQSDVGIVGRAGPTDDARRQNRVNPATLAIIPAAQTGGAGEFWVTPDDKDVRPYGFLIRRHPSGGR